MDATRTKAEVRRRDGVAVIDLPAQIDNSAEQTLTEAYATATRGEGSRIVLNFAGVEYLSSTGIALIVGMLAKARKDAKAISSFGLSDHYREIFEITRLADFMKMYADESAAVSG